MSVFIVTKTTIMRISFALLLSLTFGVALSAQTNVGVASYYAPGFHGKRTSTGEKYDHAAFTCANKDYPRESILRVTRLDDGRSVEVRINDCGPHRKGRIIDVSGAAAKSLGLIEDGIAQVRVDLVKLGTGKLACGGTYKPADSPPVTATTPAPTVYEKRASTSTATQPVPKRASTPKTTESAPPIEGQGTYRAEALRPIEKGFGVQVGSYRVYENAAEMAKGLQDKGYSKVLIRLQGNVHQVVLGPFDTRESAATYRENLMSKYKIDGFVIAIEQ